MAAFFRSIKVVLKKYPPITNCLTYGSLFCTAELTQQILIKKYFPSKQGEPTENLDTEKLQRYAILVIVKKVVLDQVFLTIPILFIFFTAMSYWEGKQDITQEFREKFAKTYATSCAFWLPAQTINFKFVSPALRISYNGACGFVWANILCLLKREGETKPETKEE